MYCGPDEWREPKPDRLPEPSGGSDTGVWVAVICGSVVLAWLLAYAAGAFIR